MIRKILLQIIISLFFITGYANDKMQELTFVTKRFYNAGEFKEGVVFKKTFTIKNTGNAPLIILDFVKSCTCTDIDIAKKVLKPNEETDVILTIDTKNKLGHNIITAGLVTNTQKNYVMKVTLDIIK